MRIVSAILHTYRFLKLLSCYSCQNAFCFMATTHPCHASPGDVQAFSSLFVDFFLLKCCTNFHLTMICRPLASLWCSVMSCHKTPSSVPVALIVDKKGRRLLFNRIQPCLLALRPVLLCPTTQSPVKIATLLHDTILIVRYVWWVFSQSYKFPNFTSVPNLSLIALSSSWTNSSVQHWNVCYYKNNHCQVDLASTWLPARAEHGNLFVWIVVRIKCRDA